MISKQTCFLTQPTIDEAMAQWPNFLNQMTSASLGFEQVDETASINAEISSLVDPSDVHDFQILDSGTESDSVSDDSHVAPATAANTGGLTEDSDNEIEDDSFDNFMLIKELLPTLKSSQLAKLAKIMWNFSGSAKAQMIKLSEKQKQMVPRGRSSIQHLSRTVDARNDAQMPDYYDR